MMGSISEAKKKNSSHSPNHDAGTESKPPVDSESKSADGSRPKAESEQKETSCSQSKKEEENVGDTDES